MSENYCCGMRRKFLIAIVGERKDAPTPIDIVDFILDFDRPRPLVGIRFCPFCAKPIDHTETLRDITT